MRGGDAHALVGQPVVDGRRQLMRAARNFRGKCPSRAMQLRRPSHDRLPDECVRIAAAHAATAQLGPMFGTVSLKKIPLERAA